MADDMTSDFKGVEYSVLGFLWKSAVSSDTVYCQVARCNV